MFRVYVQNNEMVMLSIASPALALVNRLAISIYLNFDNSSGLVDKRRLNLHRTSLGKSSHLCVSTLLSTPNTRQRYSAS